MFSSPKQYTIKNGGLGKHGAGPRQEGIPRTTLASKWEIPPLPPTTAIQDRNDAPSNPVRSALLPQLPKLHPLPVSAPPPPPSPLNSPQASSNDHHPPASSCSASSSPTSRNTTASSRGAHPTAYRRTSSS